MLASAQNLNNITWNPATPDECDYVEMTLTGNFPGQNYQADNFVVTPVGFTITVDLNCSGSGGGNPASFSQAIPAGGPYPAGSYALVGRLFINGNQVDTWNGNKTVTASPDPDPGGYNEATVCNTDPTAPLISFLAGTPDPGGAWLDPNGVAVSNGMFDPGVSQQGFYTYEFNQNAPCIDTSQQVLITYELNSNAGTNGTASTCVNGAPFNLFSYLAGGPDAGGSWSYQGSNVSDTFTPGTSAAGVYTYTVAGLPPCDDPTATVTVSVVQPANPGVGGSVAICETDTAFLLNTMLTGNPAQSGAWYDPNGFQMAGGWNAVVNALVDFQGDFQYRVTNAPCAPSIAVVTVTFTNAEPPCGTTDCLGVPGGPAVPGTPCSDNNPNTLWDEWTPNCDCVGSLIGIEEPEAAAALVLQPNPATDAITIESPKGLVTGYELVAVDGRTVRTETLQAHRFVVERNNIASGAYRLIIRFADGRAARAVVFE